MPRKCPGRTCYALRLQSELRTRGAAEEVTEPRGVRVAPPGVGALNPAFDVTPHELVAAIITERGVARPPYRDTLAGLARP